MNVHAAYPQQLRQRNREESVRNESTAAGKFGGNTTSFAGQIYADRFLNASQQKIPKAGRISFINILLTKRRGVTVNALSKGPVWRGVMHKVTSLCAAAAVMTVATTAHAGTISTTATTPSAAASVIGPGSTQVTFEAATPGSYTTYSENGVTFTSNDHMYINAIYAGQYNTTGQSLANTYASDAFGTLTMDFANPTSAFGFNFGASDTVWTLNAYDAANNLVDTLAINPTYGSNAGEFFGITGSGITHATLSGDASDYVLLDNLTFSSVAGAVPEPSTWAMMLLGFGAMGLTMRRKKPSTALVPAA